MFEVHYFPIRILCFDRKSTSIAQNLGWLPGARYHEIRHVRKQTSVGLIDVNWKNYNFDKHLKAIQLKRPLLTVAQDIVRPDQVEMVLRQAKLLSKYVSFVVVVPKIRGIVKMFLSNLNSKFVAGYSIPTGYGGTTVPIEEFIGHPVHLLGGRPDVQRALAQKLEVISIDSNRLTLDASYGDSFDGETFRPNAKGGLYNCISDSIVNINRLWLGYKPKLPQSTRRKVIRWLNKHQLREIQRTTRTKPNLQSLESRNTSSS